MIEGLRFQNKVANIRRQTELDFFERFLRREFVMNVLLYVILWACVFENDVGLNGCDL